MNLSHIKRAFTLLELLLVIAILTLLVGVLIPAVTRARDAARLSLCSSNLGTYGKTLGTYANENRDLLYAFSWKPTDSPHPKLAGGSWSATTDTQAAANQAVDILQRVADRTDIPAIVNWTPHIRYTHLLLSDYFEGRLPSKISVCPSDKDRVAWQRDPRNFPGAYHPVPVGANTPQGKRHPYSATYVLPAAVYDRNTIAANRFSLDGLGWQDAVPSTRCKFGGNRLADVTFTSSKVLTYDDFQRHGVRSPVYFGYDDVTIPIAFFDASVRTKRVGDANFGWKPQNPAARPTEADPCAGATVYYYEETGGGLFPSARSSAGIDAIVGRFAWTRAGLRGNDFGGNEIDAR